MVIKVVSMVADWAYQGGRVVPSLLYRYCPADVESNNSLWDQRQRSARRRRRRSSVEGQVPTRVRRVQRRVKVGEHSFTRQQAPEDGISGSHGV